MGKFKSYHDHEGKVCNKCKEYKLYASDTFNKVPLYDNSTGYYGICKKCQYKSWKIWNLKRNLKNNSK